MSVLKMIEQYRDLTISMEELSKTVNVHRIAPHEYSGSVIVCTDHVINVLEKYKKDEISELGLARWPKFIMFSEWYDYCQENYESNASVVAELEAPLVWLDFCDEEDDGELYEPMEKLSPDKADTYIHALKNNVMKN
jgi:hypothetical protein